MMKCTLLSLLVVTSCSAFSVAPRQSFVSRGSNTNGRLSSSTAPYKEPLMDLPTTKAERNNLVSTAERLKEEYGIFVIEKSAKEELQQAVEALENLSEPPVYSYDRDDPLLGEWELVCTTATSAQGVDTSKLPFFNDGPLKQIRDSITKTTNKYLKVEQIIKATKDDGVIDRVDHVLQYEPPEELQDVLDNLPEQLTKLNINPLHVSKSKLVLIHKASVESPENPLKIKLGLQSIVLNVAGTSTFLDPEGKDVTGINIPLGEFVNAGDFETTYMDDDVRISRGKRGFADQLRVFVRAGKLEADAALKDIKASDKTVGMGVDAELDVDEVVDEDFAESPSDVEPEEEE